MFRLAVTLWATNEGSNPQEGVGKFQRAKKLSEVAGILAVVALKGARLELKSVRGAPPLPRRCQASVINPIHCAKDFGDAQGVWRQGALGEVTRPYPEVAGRPGETPRRDIRAQYESVAQDNVAYVD